MQPEELIRQGKLDEAIEALGAHLRDNPGDARRRTSLFELLCFAGEYDRAEKHLKVLADANKDTAVGSLLYQTALHASRIRDGMFDKDELPVASSAGPVAGSLNGKPFQTISDSDPRVGARLEVFAAGDYMWIPLEHVESLAMEPPKRLRDLLWAPAMLKTGPGFKKQDLGEVLLPALSPLTWRHPEGEVRLGRATEWCADEQGREMPYGLKMLLVDGEEFPLLEVRRLEIRQPDAG